MERKRGDLMAKISDVLYDNFIIEAQNWDDNEPELDDSEWVEVFISLIIELAKENGDINIVR